MFFALPSVTLRSQLHHTTLLMITTTARLLTGDAAHMADIDDVSVDLMVTSPPYPMIEMWDGAFAKQDERIRSSLSEARGGEAFELMHSQLDRVWSECRRVLKPGGIACVNIGDATRTLEGDFQLYSNHSRILSWFLSHGFSALPDILWRKPTNAPTKFMGSGMLPVGAYVTYEHEYILILRNGRRREFASPREKARRRLSAFFWEERNLWFSDIWLDLKGATQGLVDKAARSRSAAFPYELSYRLICMFSIKEDIVLDPFAGTGTTLAAAAAAGRNALGFELDEKLVPVGRQVLRSVPGFANAHNRERIHRHLEFAARRMAESGPLKHRNSHYGFPVMTAQERELLINDVVDVSGEDEALTIRYEEGPRPEFVRPWRDEELLARHTEATTSGSSTASLGSQTQSTAEDAA